MDVVTLALAKKYTDEKTSGGGSVPDATTTTKGIVMLNSSVTSTSETEAATPKAVKTAMDRANAAFQSADNGKKSIVSAIGSPAVDTDTFVDIANRVSNAKGEIAKNLTAKGVSSSGVEPLLSLANKIAAISAGTSGKKFSSGTSPAALYGPHGFNGVNGVFTNVYAILVSGVGFDPRVIVAYSPVGLNYFTVYFRDLGVIVMSYFMASQNSVYNFHANGNATVVGNSAYFIPAMVSSNTSQPWYWYAYE